MNIIVCIKQVPDAKELKIDPVTGSLMREGVPAVINPDDKHALEAAVTIKEQHGGKVTVLTMGPAQAAEALRECLAMGADEAILLSDRAFGGADTWATSYTLGCAIQKIGNYDLVICGRQATDGNTAQVGPQLAETLELPQVTYVQGIEANGKTLKIRKALEDGFEIVEIGLPVLLTVTKDINTPRIPAIDAIMDSFSKDITIWTVNDIPVDKSQIGLKGSPTRIRKVYTPNLKRGQVEMLDGELDEAVRNLIDRLSAKELI
ncbi:MAG: electron transfer flavoprotein subunit beta/FixA family protein [Dehalococcoidales bacterium]|nr:electron transfer flavoprotein subunit beta/FixA family protein [Dehalococcoidales bacterium]